MLGAGIGGERLEWSRENKGLGERRLVAAAQ
jgi:hypothetical protein